ncbi:MAG: antitoxin HicB [Lysobacterales bacterium]|jgi:antitoxin HicB
MSEEYSPIGSSFEDWLEEEGIWEDATNYAIKCILVDHMEKYLEENKLSKTSMAKRMNTSRAALDRLLDRENYSVTLNTLQNAARAIGARLELNLSFKNKAA